MRQTLRYQDPQKSRRLKCTFSFQEETSKSQSCSSEPAYTHNDALDKPNRLFNEDIAFDEAYLQLSERKRKKDVGAKRQASCEGVEQGICLIVALASSG